MANSKIILSKVADPERLKPFRTNAALILTTLMLMVAAATTVATAQTYTDLYNFDGTDGAEPQYSLLAQGRDGNWYGTASFGGANGYGVVFRITPGGKLKALYNFEGVHGSYPYGGLTLGTDGNFYGTTYIGGNGYGTIFKVTKNGSLTTLLDFTESVGEPFAPPIQGADGNFYGTTGAVAAYKITSSGTFGLLGTLPGGSTAPLFQATNGNFYGTTYDGGSSGYGTVFKMTPKGTVTTVYSFDGAHGELPYAPVIQGSHGNFYGTAYQGGSYGEGVAFKLTPQGAITVLHNFGDPGYPNDGNQPDAGLVQATDGNFYGVTYYGRAMGYGVIFQITAAGAYSILYNFDGADGANASTTPMQHTTGKIYGLAAYGGTSGDGVVYSFDVGLGPFVSLVSASGKVGKTIEVLGQGFTGTTAVSFNGTAATFTEVRDTYLKTTVPSGATTGPVTVTTPGASLTSNTQFRVTPKILSFSPTSGPAGTPVTITGNSLTQTTRVDFDWLKAASFTVNSDTEVTAVVPTGATTGHIQIRTKGGLAVSSGVFTVTQ